MYQQRDLGTPLRDILARIQQRIMTRCHYMGIPTMRSPFDAWAYQEIVSEQKPDAIVEVGVYCGGQTLQLAHLLDAMGRGRIIGVDVTLRNVRAPTSGHPRVTLIESDAVAAFEKVRDLVGSVENVLVIEDSAHTYENTLAVMRLYGTLVRRGGYMIVEDTICHHGLDVGPSPGPFEAVEEFLKTSGDFVRDVEREPVVTWNPGGYLRRQ